VAVCLSVDLCGLLVCRFSGAVGGLRNHPFVVGLIDPLGRADKEGAARQLKRRSHDVFTLPTCLAVYYSDTPEARGGWPSFDIRTYTHAELAGVRRCCLCRTVRVDVCLADGQDTHTASSSGLSLSVGLSVCLSACCLLPLPSLCCCVCRWFATDRQPSAGQCTHSLLHGCAHAHLKAG